ncbi:MAG: MFS transporter [Pirellulaceae bacterium]
MTTEQTLNQEAVSSTQENEVLETLGHGIGQSIWGPSFQGLLWTNWLTAINDNVFRWFAIGFGKQLFPADQHATVLALGTASFVMPYLLFAVPAGWFADRFSKRQVIVACKIAEIVIMSLALLMIYLQSFYGLMVAVFLMGGQSALFAPAKVGTIPELLDEKKISAGNGLFNLATLSATVIGMALGGWLADQTAPHGTNKLWLVGVVVLGIATLGTVISLLVTRLPAANPTLRFSWNIPGAMVRDFNELFRNRRLFRVALGVVFFWSFASLAQINIDAFVDESGSFLESERTPMLISLVLGVGFGSLLAGIASRGRIELGLVPWAAMGMVLFCVVLYFSPRFFKFEIAPMWQQVYACVGLAFLGMSGGFFDVPIYSYLQENSPPRSRGAILAASNFMLFSGVLLTSALFFAVRSPTWAPELSNVPTVYRLENLSADQQAIIKDLTASWKPQGTDVESIANMTKLVSTVPPELRGVAGAQLVFEGLKQTAATDSPLQSKDLSSAFANANLIQIADGTMTAPLTPRIMTVASRAATKQPLFSSRQVFLLMGALTIPVLIYTLWRLGRQMATVGFYWFVKLLYRWRITGAKNIPEEGGAVLVANHSSWLDATLMMLVAPRHVSMIAWAGNFNNPFMKWFANFAGVILISGGPKSIARGLKEARRIVNEGGLVGLFPEGGISRNCQVKTFKPGIMKIIEGTDAPVIPMYIDETWGTAFSYSGGRPFFKIPRTFRKGISVHVGEPIQKPIDLHTLRQRVQELGAFAVNHRSGKFVSPVTMFVGACKRRLFRFKCGDSLGTRLSGGSLLMRSLILRRLLRKHVLKNDEQYVAVLVPPSVGGVVVNMALALDKRVSVNLNYSVSPEIMDFCIEEAGIRHVLTTDKVMEKFSFDFGERKCTLDGLRDKVTLADKIISALQAYVVPKFILSRVLGLEQIEADDLLTLIFTSGSTGKPKGVMLTHQNVASNVVGIEQVASLNSQDVFAGILPFFHSFGYTVTMWSSMSLNTAGAFHVSPLDARQVGKLVQTFKATLLLATPTFLRTYMKRCTPEEFKSLELVVVGAEKMPIDLADSFEEKFGIRPIEGYGATELSPLVSVNVPKSRQMGNWQVDSREGTVGRPIPTVAAKITDLDTGEELGKNQAGMLWIKGPNVMKGYLNHPEKTAETIIDGWYKTGDVGLIDDDGFIKLTGRMSRFSKIGGEMVPHVTIEEELMKLIGDNDSEQSVAVTAVPDAKKGERLIVFHTEISQSVDDLRSGLTAAGLPNLFIPSADSFRQVESIPVLGTGKLDLKGLKDLALETLAAMRKALVNKRKYDMCVPNPKNSRTRHCDALD